MDNDTPLNWTNSELFCVKTWLYLFTESIFHSCILDPVIESVPEGITLIVVLLVSYPLPPEIMLTPVIFPSETMDSNLAYDPTVPVVPPTPTTSNSGGVVYSEPALKIFTPVTFPSMITGAINASLPVSSLTLGLRR